MKNYTKIIGILSILTISVAFIILIYTYNLKIINITSLCLGVLGVYVLIHFIALNRFGFKELDVSNQFLKRIFLLNIIFFIAIITIVFFPLLQENIRKSQIETLSKLKDFGNDKNILTGSIGSLKSKFENDKLYYQVTLEIPKIKLDSISDFSIQFYDKDGFLLNEFSLLSSNNIIYEEKGNIMKYFINDNIKFSSEMYLKIEKWELIGLYK